MSINIIKRLLVELDNAVSPSDIDAITKSLVKLGKSIIPALIDFTRSLPIKSVRREKVMHVLQKFGYPDIESAIPFIIDLASDPNSPGWNIATQTLLEIGEPVIPYLKDALLHHIDRIYDSEQAVESLCTIINQFNPELQKAFIPEFELLRKNDHTP